MKIPSFVRINGIDYPVECVKSLMMGRTLRTDTPISSITAYS